LISISIYTYTYIHIYLYLYIHTHIYVYIYIYTHTHTHIYIYIYIYDHHRLFVRGTRVALLRLRIRRRQQIELNWMLAFIQYCYYQYCLVYSMQTGFRRISRILPNNRAIVLHQGGQCRCSGGMKGWMIRAQQPRSKTISCKGSTLVIRGTRVALLRPPPKEEATD